MTQAAQQITSDTLDDEIPEDDAVCSVCGFSDLSEDNPIIMCDSCQVCVHVKCYAISEEALKKDKWFCLPCSKGVYLRNPDSTPNPQRRCVACSHLGGAFSQTVDERWVHTSCALYLPGATISLQGVTLPEHPAAGQQECVLCKRKLGLTRKCSFIDCNQYMHIHCMIRHDCLIDGFSHPNLPNKIVECVFCPTHSKLAETNYDDLCAIYRRGEVCVCTKKTRDELRNKKSKDTDVAGSSSENAITITTTHSGREVKRPTDASSILVDRAAIDAIKDSITDENYPSSDSDSDEPHKRHRRRTNKGQKAEDKDEEGKEGEGRTDEPEKKSAAEGGEGKPAPKRRGRKPASATAEAKQQTQPAPADAQALNAPGLVAPSLAPAQAPAAAPAGTPPAHIGQPVPLLFQHQMTLPAHNVPMGSLPNTPFPFNIQPPLPPPAQAQVPPSGVQPQINLLAAAAAYQGHPAPAPSAPAPQ